MPVSVSRLGDEGVQDGEAAGLRTGALAGSLHYDPPSPPEPGSSGETS
jgi:hypothetical protein